MGHLTLSTYGSLAAASLLLLGCSLLCLLVLQRRRELLERGSARRRRAICDALEHADVAALGEICREALTRADVRADLRASAAPRLTLRQRHVLAAAAQATGLLGAVRSQLRSADSVTRGHAAALVALLATDGPERELEPLLEDDDLDVRLATARAIGELDSRAGARVLIRALERGSIEPDRLLEQLARPSAARELVLAAHRPESAPIRSLLAEALGLTRSLHGLATLASLVRVGSDEERLRACRALGRIGRPEVVPLLLEALADDSWAVRAQAARGLTGLAEASAVAELARALGDRAWWVRANAAEALRAAGPQGVAALEHAARGTDRFAAERAREALALAAADGQRTRPSLEIAA